MAEDTEQTELVAVRSEESEFHSEDVVIAKSSDQQTTITIYRHFCKGCEICAEVCPKGVLQMVVAADRWEGSIVEIIDINACNACMLCEYQCPDFAIEVMSIKKEKKKKEKEAVA